MPIRERKREPIKKLVVITQPFSEKSRPEVRKKKLAEIKRLVSERKEEKGTHFIVSWGDREDRDRAVQKILTQIHPDRLHEPVTEECNFFEDDKKIQKNLGKIGFGKEVEIESWGESLEGCAPRNVRGVLDFLDSKKVGVKKITFLGGDPASFLVKEAIYGKLSNEELLYYHDYSHAFKELHEDILAHLGKHKDKLVIAWPIKKKEKSL